MKSIHWTRRRILIISGISHVLIIGLAVSLHPAGQWRIALIKGKMTGAHPDLGWGELVRQIVPGGNTSVENERPFLTRRNPRTSAADVEAGGVLYRSQCAACHGIEGEGGLGADLAGGAFRHGGGDWALFRSIADGVAGTTMEGIELPEESIWQLVSYVRTLSVGENSGGSTTGAVVEVLDDISAVSSERLVHATDEPQAWLTYSGDFYSQRHSGLREINRRNVGQLELKWVVQMQTIQEMVETTPLVVDGVMFVTEPPNNVYALDATSGAELWRYERRLEGRLSLCCGRVNRGLAVLGDRLYLGTLDAHLVALDIRTGNVIWDVERADAAEGYSGTAAPLAVGDKIIVGIAGGEFGIRGFVDAYDATTGDRVWRFHTVPAPGEPGSDTWSGDSWITGGAPTWLTGSYDSDLNLLYWTTGNPAPDYQGENRAGDNLYSNSVIALHAETGEMAWHFQFTPHDVHDWDAVQIPVLADANFQGRPRKLMLFANRNAFYYVFDRETGELLLAEPYARQNWTEGIGPDGRPVIVPEIQPSEEGTLTYPGDGATNWWSPSYSPRTGLLYVPAMELGGVFFRGETITQGAPGSLFMGSTNRLLARTQGRSSIVALIPQTGQKAWEHDLPAFSVSMAGVLSTAGDLVFTGHAVGGVFLALDATTGEKLWEASLGGPIRAAPMSYAVGGHQFVTIAAGRAIFTFGLN